MMSDVGPPVWEPPPPRQLPALREHLADYLRSDPAHVLTEMLIRQRRGTLRPQGDPAIAAHLMLEDERQRLTQAQLFYVTADITKLVQQAAPSLRDRWDIQPHDLPALTGFMLFAEPMTSYPRDDGKDVAIVAVSWGSTELLTCENDGLWITFWSATDFTAIARLLRRAGVPAADAPNVARTQNAELTWDNEIYMPWGATNPTLADPGARIRRVDPTQLAAAKTTLEWLRIVHAAWIFCQPNTLTDTVEEHLPRSQRVRAQRLGIAASPVRVVSVSRKTTARSAKPSEPSGRTVSVRFPVAPFIRRQAYGPGRTLRRLTPVAGHWRGPADAPVRISRKVNLVDTPPSPAEE